MAEGTGVALKPVWALWRLGWDLAQQGPLQQGSSSHHVHWAAAPA